MKLTTNITYDPKAGIDREGGYLWTVTDETGDQVDGGLCHTREMAELQAGEARGLKDYEYVDSDGRVQSHHGDHFMGHHNAQPTHGCPQCEQIQGPGWTRPVTGDSVTSSLPNGPSYEGEIIGYVRSLGQVVVRWVDFDDECGLFEYATLQLAGANANGTRRWTVR